MRLVVLMLIALSVSAQTVQEPAVEPYEDPEAYKIYSALLESSGRHTILIQEETATMAPDFSRLKQRLKKQYRVASSAVDDFESKNAVNWKLQPQFSLAQRYYWLGSQTLPHASVGFFNPFLPERYFQFSPVGFDSKKTTALVAILYLVNCGHYIFSSCEGASGEGRFAILHKHHGVWKEIDCGKQCIAIAVGEF